MSDQSHEHKVGLTSLIGIVVSSMIGGGVFSLPTDMARGASIVGILCGWLVTGVGIICLALVYQNLANRKPELDGGIYAYASAGFGKFMGFNSAWGYWLSAVLGNVAYALLLFNALSFFFPIFRGNHNIYVFFGASLVLWVIHWIALRGVREALVINIVTTIARLVPVFLFVVVGIFAWHWHNITFQPFGTPTMGGIMHQIKSTIMTTVWVFIGVEGAIVLSQRAKNKKDVGKATVIGLLLTLVIYVLVNMVALAAVPRDMIMHFDNPTLAYTLAYVVGPWGAWVINVGLVVAIFGAFLGWTLLASEIPHVAARDHVMPEVFGRENVKQAPFVSLWITNIVVQLLLLLPYISNSTYQALYTVSVVAIVPPYFLSALYGLKLVWQKETYQENEKRGKDLAFALVASVYGAWLLYASDLKILLVCSAFYLVGVCIFAYSRMKAKKHVFTKWEWIIALLIFIATLVALWEIAHGNIHI